MANRIALCAVHKALTRRGMSALAAGTLLAAFLAGCAVWRPTLVDSPLSIEQQQQAVLDIVPRGLPRDEVERRLKNAGIEYRKGGNGSIYYLMLWNRADGQRWHIDVALLFDQSGRLYQTRAGSASWEARPDEPLAGRGGAAKAASAETAAPPDSATTAAAEDERIPFPKR